MSSNAKLYFVGCEIGIFDCRLYTKKNWKESDITQNHHLRDGHLPSELKNEIKHTAEWLQGDIPIVCHDLESVLSLQKFCKEVMAKVA